MKKNILIFLLILIDVGFLIFAFIQMTLANKERNIANEYKFQSNFVQEKLVQQQKTIVHQDSLINELKKTLMKESKK